MVAVWSDTHTYILQVYDTFRQVGTTLGVCVCGGFVLFLLGFLCVFVVVVVVLLGGGGGGEGHWQNIGTSGLLKTFSSF